MTATRNPDQTRQTLLDAAFEEIHEHGFQAASLDNILAKTGVTKGALYHHFKNKMELGYAVVEEVIRPMDPASSGWSRFRRRTTRSKRFGRIFDATHSMNEQACQCGCPLNNLAQEMSPLDEGFRQRIQAVLEAWRGGIADILRRGQASGTVRNRHRRRKRRRPSSSPLSRGPSGLRRTRRIRASSRPGATRSSTFWTA